MNEVPIVDYCTGFLETIHDIGGRESPVEPRYWTVRELKRGADYRGYHVRERTPAFDFLKEKALTGVSLRGLSVQKTEVRSESPVS